MPSTSKRSTERDRSTKGNAPTQARIEETIQEEIERRSMDPKKINQGDCESFALAVKNRLQDPDELEVTGSEISGAWTMGRWGGHVWICAHHLGTGKGLHFDVECPKGTSDWQNLPFYKRRMEDPADPIGPVSDAILSAPTQVTDEDVIRYIEDWSDVNCVYKHKTDGSRQASAYFDPDEEWHVADATYTPTIWIRGKLPVSALKDCLFRRRPGRRCPEREEWREWLREENEMRKKKGFDSYHSWLEGGIKEPIIVDGQGPLIWDGWHRTAWAIDQGKETVPAFLGIDPGRKSALEVANA